MDAEVLARRLERARAEIAGLEQIIETKARDLYLSRERAERNAGFLETVLHSMTNGLLVLDSAGQVLRANPAACSLLGQPEEQLVGRELAGLIQLPPKAQGRLLHQVRQEACLLASDGKAIPVLYSCGPMGLSPGGAPIDGFVCVWIDMTEVRRLEVELRHSQKLESLGQMAAGVAHEINTPIQFVGDSLAFLQEATEDLLTLLRHYREGRAQWGAEASFAALEAELVGREQEADLEFIEAEAPSAFERATKGLARVAHIVRALRDFSHPGTEGMAAADLNEVLRNTLVLAHNEYKYVADVDLALDELPRIPCHPGDLGQVFLNLVVNASHAIEEKHARTGERGLIRIRSSRSNGWVSVQIEDTGMGIPLELAERIFDPFFTTKAVGRGSGQGLAISRRIVVEKHGGHLRVESRRGEGTTFFIELPERADQEAA